MSQEAFTLGIEKVAPRDGCFLDGLREQTQTEAPTVPEAKSTGTDLSAPQFRTVDNQSHVCGVQSVEDRSTRRTEDHGYPPKPVPCQ